jgi:serine/threonine protein kinase/tetratricopeptide (TPR) repeat protein
MTPERWQQVKGLLQEALELAPAQRQAFLDRACSNDDSLRREVESLLSSDDKARSTFLQSAPNVRLALTKGTRLGDFEILSLLGAGGMGEVYRARDHRLDRDVAIKVLPRFVSLDPERLRRFEQEAKAAAALNHPNIVAVFHMGSYEGVSYLVSELLEGDTLREQLKHGPLPPRKAIDYGIQIAHGLAAAHERGIVHRDLKPENLFATRNSQVKILDFGLAKLMPPESETQLTKQTLDTEPGVVMGTVGYMSPEQVRGQPADQGSDIFAFGAILYEMLSGQRAFHKPTSVETMSAILNEDPPALSQVVPNPPAALQCVVSRCLEKDPANRYSSGELVSSLEESSVAPQSLRESHQWRWYAMVSIAAAALVLAISILRFNLRGWRNHLRLTAGTTQIESLAVLPFANVSGDSRQDYFVDGMTDQLITDLAQIARLRVTSRTSAMQFRDTKKPVPQIARDLNVDAVVEGSVMHSGDRVRITAQLIEAKTDRNLWARSYERNSRDVMALQDELARDISEEIRVTLTPEEDKRLVASRTPNPQAYDAYLRGRYFWSRRTEAELHKAKDYFEQAIAADPAYAPAYSGLADTYFYLSYAWGHMPPMEGMPLSRAAALKAIELDDSAGEGHASLGVVKFSYDWDFAGAEQELKRAVRLSPNFSNAHQTYAVLLGVLQRPDESLAEIRKAVEVDPLSMPVRNMFASRLATYNRCDESLAEDRRTLELDPNATHMSMLHDRMAGCYRAKGMEKEFLEEWTEARKANGATPQEIEDFQKTYATSGRNAILRKDLQVQLHRWEKDHWHRDGWEIAMAYANLGENDEAFAWIEKLIELRCTMLFWLYDGDNPLRKDPRFAEVKRKMGIPN